MPHALNHADISAVVCIYRPDMAVLNRCLEQLLPQVGEIVVVVDAAGLVPKLALCHAKVRYQWLPEKDVGYGRKANYGVKIANRSLLWLINDDCFAAADCGEKLLEVINSDEKIGMVGHELRFEDGTLQHGGTMRQPGAYSFLHTDTYRTDSRWKEPVEMEAVTGASVLMRRRAFESAGLFFEKYHLYLEDSDLCLSMRKAGWKIFYTPHAKAVHLQNQSTSRTPNINEHIRRSYQTFQSRWKSYFDRNKNNPGLGVFE